MNRGVKYMVKYKELESDICFDKIDFENGVRLNEGLLTVRWPNDIYLKLIKTWAYHLTIERDGNIFMHQIFKKSDERLIIWVQRWSKDISDGKYNTKKTERERILDIIVERSLTSYMNNTKWREFRAAMLEEMPFEPPYDYKTLFDENDYIDKEYIQYFINNDGPYSFGSFDNESFHFLNYKAIEWVKIRPRFYALEGGQLVKTKKWYDCEKEFIDILKKYSIPYEVNKGVYTIYGYK